MSGEVLVMDFSVSNLTIRGKISLEPEIWLKIVKNPEVFGPGQYFPGRVVIQLNSGHIILFKTGSFFAAGCKSIDEAKQRVREFEEFLRREVGVDV